MGLLAKVRGVGVKNDDWFVAGSVVVLLAVLVIVCIRDCQASRHDDRARATCAPDAYVEHSEHYTVCATPSGVVLREVAP